MQPRSSSSQGDESPAPHGAMTSSGRQTRSPARFDNGVEPTTPPARTPASSSRRRQQSSAPEAPRRQQRGASGQGGTNTLSGSGRGGGGGSGSGSGSGNKTRTGGTKEAAHRKRARLQDSSGGGGGSSRSGGGQQSGSDRRRVLSGGQVLPEGEGHDVLTRARGFIREFMRKVKKTPCCFSFFFDPCCQVSPRV